MKLIRKYFLLLFIICLGVVLYVFYQKNKCHAISCITTKQLNITSVNAIYEQSTKTYRALYNTSYGLLRVEKQANLSESEAQLLTKASIMTTQGLFASARSPYPGPLSDKISCMDKYKINTQEFVSKSTAMTWFVSYTNNRLQYGVCVDSEIAYTGYVGILYCKTQKSWYRIELLVSSTKTEYDPSYIKLLQEIQCAH